MKSSKRYYLISLLIALLLIGNIAYSHTYFIDPEKGNSQANGSVDDPFASILNIKNLSAGDTVFLLNGIHKEKTTLSAKGTGNAPIVIMAYEDKKAIVEGQTWVLKEAAFLVIQNLTFRNSSPAILFAENSNDITIQNNDFIDCPSPGATPYERALFGEGPNSHRNKIINNLIKRAYETTAHEGPEAINIKEGNQKWIIQGNSISGYMLGIQLGIGARGAPPGYITISENEIFACNEGVHVKTSDNVISGNYIHDLKKVGYIQAGYGVYLRSSPRTLVENNRIDQAQTCGIRVSGNDELLRNNLITNTPIGIWMSNHSYGIAGKSIWIVHNTILSPLPIWVSAGEVFIYNNVLKAEPGSTLTVFNKTINEVNPMERINPVWFRAYSGTDISGFSFIADYNLYQYGSMEQSLYPLYKAEIHPKIKNEWWGSHNKNADITFVDPSNGDYRLKPGSAGISMGRHLPNCPYDINGLIRDPNQADVGAFQRSTGIRVFKP